VRDDAAQERNVLGIVLTAVGAFALGAVAGMAMGGAVGKVHRGRVRTTLDRLSRHAPRKPAELEQAVLAAFRDDEATSDLDLHVAVADQGLVELTGVAPDATLRRVAGDIARGVPGVEVVVNRIMIRDPDKRAAPHLRSV
jgi:osmotically-inducible protein OsmY